MYIINIIFETFKILLPNLNFIQLTMFLLFSIIFLFYFLQHSFGRVFVRNFFIILIINFLIFYMSNYSLCKNEINDSINKAITPNVVKGVIITSGILFASAIIGCTIYSLPYLINKHYMIPIRLRSYKLEAEILSKRDPVMEVIMTNPSAIRQPKNAIHLDWLIFLKEKYLQYLILSNKTTFKTTPNEWIIIGEGIHQINTKYQALNSQVTDTIIPYLDTSTFELAKNLSNVDSSRIMYVPPFVKSLLTGLNNLNGQLDNLIKEYPIVVMSAQIDNVELRKFSASYLLGLKYNASRHLQLVDSYKKYTFNDLLMAYPVSPVIKQLGLACYPFFSLFCYLLGIPNPITEDMYFNMVNQSLNLYGSPYNRLGTLGINETDLFNKIDLTRLGDDPNELICRNFSHKR